MWFVFGPIILFFFAGALLFPLPADRAGMLFAGVCFLAVLLFVSALVRYARLEVSETGIRLRQTGYLLEALWLDIIRLRLARGHEAFVTSKPVGGKGAGTLAAAANFTRPVVSFYDSEQRALLDEHRLIPIEAFAWHLHHGKLRGQIERFAPHLKADLAILDAPLASTAPREARQPASRPPSRPWTAGQWAIMSLIPICVAAGIFLGMSSKPTQAVGLQALKAFSQAAFALYLVFGARDFFRRGSWLFGAGLALVSVLVALWAFATSFGIAEKLGAGGAFMQAFATLLFALLAVRLAYGVRTAFRRRFWALGAVFLLFAIFLAFCAVESCLDFARPRATVHRP